MSIVWLSGAARETPHRGAPARAADILDVAGLTEHRLHALSHDARDRVRRTTGREWNDDRDRSRGICLRLHTRNSLAVKGVDAERLALLRSPAGLDIGAVTPEEIALSILAEIVELRRRGARTSVDDRTP